MAPSGGSEEGGAPRVHVTRAEGMSIKTKVIIGMSGLAAAIVIILFIIIQSIVSSSTNETINQAGVGYMRLMRASGSMIDQQLNDRALLDLRRRHESDFTQPWSQVLNAHLYTASSRFHPAAVHTSYDQLRADLFFMMAANFYVETGTENNAKAIEVLGDRWAESLDHRAPAPRAVKTRIGDGNKPPGIKDEDWTKLKEAQDGKGNVGESLFALFNKLRERVIKQAEESFAKETSADGQLASIVYSPPAGGMKFFEDLAASLGKPLDRKTAYQVAVNVRKGFSWAEEGSTTNDTGLVYDEGTIMDDGTAVRRYRTTSAGASDPQKLEILLRSSVIAQATTKTMVTISVVAVLSLIIAITIAFIMGGSITAPIQQLMKDVNIIATGNFSHQPKVRTKDEVGALAKVLGEMAQSLKVGQDMFRENMERKHELSLATEIQENLLPKKTPKIPGYDISAFYSTSKEVGGDYYDFFLLDKFHLGAICADVSGKGVPGSMVMMMAKALITYEAMDNLSPKDIFVKVNKAIAKDIKRGMFVTAFYAVLDIQHKEMTVASAGHNPMLVYRAATGQIEKVNPGGIALGFDKSGLLFEKNIQEQKVKLNSGDRVVIFTDGVTEA
ncbi:MAG: SpoIIE family protein phosphatase, partial [Planctomycetes bacterium]|nr:SpoIIE family protein phosphatase [Planctomycetota bacterium]